MWWKLRKMGNVIEVYERGIIIGSEGEDSGDVERTGSRS